MMLRARRTRLRRMRLADINVCAVFEHCRLRHGSRPGAGVDRESGDPGKPDPRYLRTKGEANES